MFRVKRHSVIALAPPNGISPHHLVRCGIDDRKDVLILEIDVDLAGDRIVRLGCGCDFLDVLHLFEVNYTNRVVVRVRGVELL